MWQRKKVDAGWLKCRPPYSFYHDFIETYWAGGPSEETAACIHRICTLARKMSVESFLIEDAVTRPDVEEEIAHLESFLPGIAGSVTARQVTFLSIAPRANANIKRVRADDVICQFVILTHPTSNGERSYLFEAVMRLPRKGVQGGLLLNNYISVCSLHDLQMRDRHFRIPAAYFCQQNGITSICAHSAVRTLVRTKTRHSVSTADLNRLWRVHSPGDPIPALRVQEALKHFGLNAILYDFEGQHRIRAKSQSDVIWDLLALLADTGSPTLLMLASGTPVDHVVSVIGHTFNSDEWHPVGTVLHADGQDRAASSSRWIDHLVIHDDMLGPYYCLSRAGLFAGNGEEAPRPRMAIAILPSDVDVSPSLAEDAGRLLLDQIIDTLDEQQLGSSRWWRTLMERRERRLYRTTLIDRDTYCDMLEKQAPPGEDARSAVMELKKALPDRMWMCEISLPNLFLGNGTKLGEVLIDSKAFATDQVLESVRAFRLPSLLGWAIGDDQFKVERWPAIDQLPINAPYRHSNWW